MKAGSHKRTKYAQKTNVPGWRGDAKNDRCKFMKTPGVKERLKHVKNTVKTRLYIRAQP